LDDNNNLDLTLTPDEDTQPQATGLTFEVSEEEGVLIIRDEEPIETSTDATPEEVTEEGEFTLPDSFEISEKYSSETYVEDPFRIRTTYVPRFTEVSETYRMKNDPRPLPRKEQEPVSGLLEDTPLDPTAELDRDSEAGKVVVSSTPQRIGEPIDESLTMFKFSVSDFVADGESIPEASRTPVQPQPQEEPEPIKEEPEEDFFAPVDTDVPLVSPTPSEPYTMPDPQGGEFSRSSVTEEASIELPEGADDPTDRVGEFNNYGQRDEIKDRFLDRLMSVRVRLISCVLVLAALVAVEVLGFLGIKATSFFGIERLPYASLIIDLQFVLCLALLAIPEIVGVFRGFFKGKVLPEINIIISLAVVFGYSAVIYYSGISNYITVGLLFAIQVLVAIIAALFRTHAEFTSFRVASRNTAKNVIDLKMTRELPRENIALDGVVDEYKSVTARMFPTAFASGFFKNSSRDAENTANTAINLGVSLGIAIVTAVVSYFLGDGLSTAAQAFAIVFMLAVPAFSTLIHKIPHRHALAVAESEDGTFVGERALYDAAGIDVLTYLDTEIFGEEDVTIRNVHLYGNAGNMTKAMKQMYAIFSVVGGPLDFVFSQAMEQRSSQAVDIDIEDDGISGILDGHRICAGTLEYMKRKGVNIPAEDLRSGSSLHDSTKLLYGAEDGEIYVRFSIRYSFSEEFTMILPYLKEQKIIPLIYTRDPNISLELVKALTFGEDNIRIMKKNVPLEREERLFRRIDSGLITYSDKDDVFNMLILARNYTAFQSAQAVTELISTMVGASLGVLIALGEMFIIPVSALAMWQVVWCLVLYIRSKLRFGIEKKEKGNQ